MSATPIRPAAAAAAAECHPDAPAVLADYIPGHAPASMNRADCNADVAVYFDEKLQQRPATETAWVSPFITELWRYFKQSYGSCVVPRTLPAPIGPACEAFGAPKPLIALLHRPDQGGGGTIALRFDAFSGFRNTINVESTDWSTGNGGLRDVLVHEACHQIEGGSQGVHDSPAFPIWGDSKWAEFCMYDFYARTGRTADAQRVFAMFSNGQDGLPSGATNAAWFKDWFFPLWRNNGAGPDVMQRFFGLLSRYFPTRTENGGSNLVYARRMTTGEYVHFSSGAAGVDLSGQAAFAFNTGFDRASFLQARADFPNITYAPAACVIGSTPCQPIRVTYPGPQRFSRSGSAPLQIGATGTAGPLRYSASGLPAGLSIDANGLITGTPSGPGGGLATVTVTGVGNTGTTSFYWSLVDRYGAIKYSDSDQCMDVANSQSANGTPVQRWGCHSPTGDSQNWTIDGEQFTAMGKCLTPAGSGTADGTGVVLWDCDGSAAQRWQVGLPGGTIHNVGSGKCLTGSDNQITIRSCDDAANQQWKLPGLQSTSYSLPAGFSRCAGEDQQCTFAGTRVVAYGAGTYAFKVADSSIACASTAFGGDTAPNLLKSCYVAPLGGPAGYTRCADEGQTCAVSGGRTIAFGANGAFNGKVATTNTLCTNATFGDPIGNVAKACYIAPAGGPSGGWVACATENGTCPAVNGQPVAYGAFGSFAYQKVSGPVRCDSATFGDVLYGEVKACYTKTAGPVGFATSCAAEGGTCTFTGTRTVAAGALGSYVFRTVTGATPCNNTAFGMDALYGAAKACYLTP